MSILVKQPLRWLCLLLLIVNAGCSGCLSRRQPSTPTAQDKPAKPDFESKPLVLLPGHFERESVLNYTKPGHWVTANMRAVANNYDATGTYQASAVTSGGLPISLAGDSSLLQVSRPFGLAKEQTKILESLIFIPYRDVPAAAANIRTDLISLSGLPQYSLIEPVKLMAPFQSHFVVLTRAPDRLAFLTMLDVINLPPSPGGAPPSFYVPVFPTPEHPVPVSRTSLGWTTTSYLLWDDWLTEELDANQQQALLDWLHFGGQIIVNGPTAVSNVQKGFLADYLPIRSANAQNMSTTDFEPLNKHWSLVEPSKAKRPRELVIPATSPVVGLKMELSPQGRWIEGTGELVAERLIGRGRIVVCAFDLADQRVRDWKSLSSFVNGALMRLPARRFGDNNFGNIAFRWHNDNLFPFDPMILSKLRFISRDLSTEGTPGRFDATGMSLEADGTDFTRFDRPDFNPLNQFLITAGLSDAQITNRNLDGNTWSYGGYDSIPQSGVAGWNDYQGVALAAKRSLLRSAAIRPPARGFVGQILLGYLLVLIPLNWGIFWLIGKVEWAWLTAPVITILGAIVVIKVAALDIGFGNAQTELTILEVHGDYPRGHYTQYAALYSSLSTRYDLEFDNDQGIALPFAARDKKRADQSALTRLDFHQTQQNKLKGFLVQSNSTNMFHAEQMTSIGGPLRIEQTESGWVFRNESKLELRDCGILFGRDPAGIEQVAWLGDVQPGEEMSLSLEPVQPQDRYQRWLQQGQFVSVDANAQRLWDQVASKKLDGLEDTVGVVDLDRLLELPELAELKSSILEQIIQTQDIPRDMWTQRIQISFEEFRSAYQRVSSGTQLGPLSLGELFDVVRGSLALNAGEIRLIGAVKSEIPSFQLKPRPQMVRRSTLLVAHLRAADLPTAVPDVNSFLDYSKGVAEDPETPDGLDRQSPMVEINQ